MQGVRFRKHGFPPRFNIREVEKDGGEAIGAAVARVPVVVRRGLVAKVIRVRDVGLRWRVPQYLGAKGKSKQSS